STYVNHTFTSHLALSASLQPFAGLEADRICEYPAAPQQLALDITGDHIRPDAEGLIRAPEAPGLGLQVAASALRRYLVETEIRIGGQLIYRTPQL
ncbi:mandelate racemase/muconate lactonizing enzyme family protein, partial [Rhodovulum sulfidophilum]|nr:mandelate racemase/muconate lactonizing enzyme family protein [Rhodovulum sulfidophilum]